MLSKFKIQTRILSGFALVLLILSASILFNESKIGGLSKDSRTIIETRIPNATAGHALVNGINASLADIGGWLLTGDPAFKTKRAATWAMITAKTAEIDDRVQDGSFGETPEAWARFTQNLAQFETALAQTETIANSPEQFPANQILQDQAAPLVAQMVDDITAMIAADAANPQTATQYEREKLRGQLAQLRETLRLGLADARAFLQSGDPALKQRFGALWAENSARFTELQQQKSLFSAAQTTAFDRVATAREKFAGLPAQLFAIRESEKWDLGRYALSTDVTPRAEALFTFLLGPQDGQGRQGGGLVERQKQRLDQAAIKQAEEITMISIELWITLAVAIILATIAGLVTARSVVPPIQNLTTTMGKLAAGDNAVDVPGTARKDELGDMAHAVLVFKNNALEREQLRVKEEESRRVETERAQNIAQLCGSFDKTVGSSLESVGSAASQLTSTANAMVTTAETTDSQTNAAAAASEEATTNVQTVAAAAEELTASISEIGRQVEQSTTITNKAVNQTEKTANTVRGLAEAAERIGNVVTLIQDIAEQTNLLALNATIEAARAGEAGKGFAVVASEVKSLATQTAQATRKISDQINTIQSETTDAVTAIDEIRTVVDEVSHIATSIASAIEEQSAATSEISTNVQHAAAGTKEVSSNVIHVAQGSSQTRDSATQVLSASSELTRNAADLRQQVEAFLRDIRAA